MMVILKRNVNFLIAPTVLAVITYSEEGTGFKKTTFQYNICTIFQIPGFYFSGL